MAANMYIYMKNALKSVSRAHVTGILALYKDAQHAHLHTSLYALF